MKKRLAVVAAAVAALAMVGFDGPAQAACDQGGPSPHSEIAEVPGTGSHIYDNGGDPGGTSGFVGVHGSTGYIQAGGDATTASGSIQGSTTDGAIDGKLSGGGGGVSLCVNDTVII